MGTLFPGVSLGNRYFQYLFEFLEAEWFGEEKLGIFKMERSRTISPENELLAVAALILSNLL